MFDFSPLLKEDCDRLKFTESLYLINSIRFICETKRTVSKTDNSPLLIGDRQKG